MKKRTPRDSKKEIIQMADAKQEESNENPEFNFPYVFGLLDECKDQLEYGIEDEGEKPTNKIKTLLRDLLELTQPPPPPPPAPKAKAKKAEKKPDAKLTAECVVCNQPEVQGQFCKRGFKCNECRGESGAVDTRPKSTEDDLTASPTTSSQKKPNAGRNSALVSSASYSKSFTFVPKPKHYDDGSFYLDPFTKVHTAQETGAPLAVTPRSSARSKSLQPTLIPNQRVPTSLDDEDVVVDEVASFRRMIGIAQLESVIAADPTKISCSVAELHLNESLAPGDAVQEDYDPSFLMSPSVARAPEESRYSVLHVPLCGDSRASVPKLRRLYNPNLLYTYSIACDAKRDVIVFVQENMPSIVEQLRAHFPMPRQFLALLEKNQQRDVETSVLSPDVEMEKNGVLPIIVETETGKTVDLTVAGFVTVPGVSEGMSSASQPSLSPKVSYRYGGSTADSESISVGESEAAPNKSVHQSAGITGLSGALTGGSTVRIPPTDPVKVKSHNSLTSLRSFGTPIGAHAQGPNFSDSGSLEDRQLRQLSIISTVGGAGGTPGVTICNTFVEYELLKKMIVTLLQALKFLHEKGFVHGDVRPHNIMFDQTHKVKLRHALFSLEPLDPPFMAPEAEAHWIAKKEDQQREEDSALRAESSSMASRDVFAGAGVDLSATVADFVKKSHATPAWDVYSLGVSIQFIAFGGIGCYPDHEVRNAEDERLIVFVEGLINADPTKRWTITQALDSPYLASVRLLNGVPVETVIAQLVREEDLHASMAASPTPPNSHVDPTEATGQATPTRASRKGSTVGSPNIGGIHSSPFLRKHGGQGKGGEAIDQLDTFLKEHGPDFQVVKPHPYSMTLYSVKSDPRRKRGQQAAEGPATRRTPMPRTRSITLPPTLRQFSTTSK